jgi:hypothetical protein
MKIHPKIAGQSMKNQCNVDIRKGGKVGLEYQGKWGNLLEFLLRPLVVWHLLYIEITFVLRGVPVQLVA